MGHLAEARVAHGDGVGADFQVGKTEAAIGVGVCFRGDAGGGVARRDLDTLVRGDAGQHERLDPAFPQHRLR